jgi:hypothetical protein
MGKQNQKCNPSLKGWHTKSQSRSVLSETKAGEDSPWKVSFKGMG